MWRAGALVKKMLESKKEAEQQQQPTKKTEIVSGMVWMMFPRWGGRLGYTLHISLQRAFMSDPNAWKVKEIAVYYDKTQTAKLWGKPVFQATKQDLNKQLLMAKKKKKRKKKRFRIIMRFWSKTGHQNNVSKTALLEADNYPTSPCCVLFYRSKKGDCPENSHVLS